MRDRAGYFLFSLARCPVARIAVVLMILGSVPLSVGAGGNVVSTWSIEESKKQNWFVVELVPQERNFYLNGALYEILEAWVEKAHRIDSIMFVIPKRVNLPCLWVCLRIAESDGEGFGHYGKEIFVALEASEAILNREHEGRSL